MATYLRPAADRRLRDPRRRHAPGRRTLTNVALRERRRADAALLRPAPPSRSPSSRRSSGRTRSTSYGLAFADERPRRWRWRRRAGSMFSRARLPGSVDRRHRDVPRPTSWPTSGSATPSRRPTGRTSGSTSRSPRTGSGCGSTTPVSSTSTRRPTGMLGRPPAARGPDRPADAAAGLFGFERYDGGAVVLHALRQELGDDAVLHAAAALGGRERPARRARRRTSSPSPTRSPAATSTAFFDDWLFASLAARRRSPADAAQCPVRVAEHPPPPPPPASRRAATTRPRRRRHARPRSGPSVDPEPPQRLPFHLTTARRSRQVDELAVPAEDQVGHRPTGEAGRRHAVAHVPSGPTRCRSPGRSAPCSASSGHAERTAQWKGNGTSASTGNSARTARQRPAHRSSVS